MQLVADRFAVMHDRRVVDLATGAEVTLIIGTAGGVSEQARWMTRCDGLQKLHRPSIGRLLDFGTLGGSQRFEAWDRSAVQPAADEPSQAARSDERDLPLERRSLTLLPSPALAWLVEIFQVAGGSRPQIVSLFGPHGSGKTTMVLELARAARLGGFVPVSVRLVRELQLQDHRSLCLFDDESGDMWPALLDMSVRSPCAHVVIATAGEERRAVHNIAMPRFSAEALAGAVTPPVLSDGDSRRVRTAAVRAQGLPGRFAGILWPETAAKRTAGRLARRNVDGRRFVYEASARRLLRAAEQTVVYDLNARAVVQTGAPGTAARRGSSGRPGKTDAPAADRQWPIPGELAALRHDMAAAVELIDAGRYAPGIRELRRTVGALARREDWSQARDGAVALGAGLLRRGQPRAAQTALEAARQYCNHLAHATELPGSPGPGGIPGSIDIAVLCSDAWIDLARLDEAEACASGAVAAARSIGDAARAAGASRALARCLFWRGQYAEAGLLLDQIRETPVDAMRLGIACLDAHIAVGLGDGARAMECAAAAVQRATASSPREQAEAHCTAGFVHLAAGDLDAADRHAGAARAAARTARDPIHSVQARLIRVETERRRGHRGAAAAEAARLRRLHTILPPLVRAGCRLAGEIVASESPPSELLTRYVGATGLAALALWLPAGVSGRTGIDPLTSEVVSILQICQTAEDENRVLARVCDRVRRHLHAAGVAWIAAQDGGEVVLASAGGRVDAAVALRAMSADVAITPHRSGDLIEAAAPVRYGGAAICGLAARWTPGSPYDLTRAAGAMAMAAAASAPIVSAALVRRAANRPAAAGELLGITPAMADLRRAIERAATAPFGVLIEGESGSGKELVARAIHRSGSRRGAPFCALNCAALPDDLVEAELFGHTRGAFTGAVAERAGVFEEAHGGTLFLDEVGELSLRAQAKILRVIQEGELRRVGENVSRRVDVRIVAATNRDLTAAASAGRFRLDLLYRLDVIRIKVPPLRERADDVAVLVDHFWREAADRIRSRATLGASTVAALARYDWPGNVRELQNVLAALAVRCPRYGVVPPTALPPQFAGSRDLEAPRLTDARRIFEERFVRAALVRTGGHRGRAASDLGVTRQGLTKLMSRLGISD